MPSPKPDDPLLCPGSETFDYTLRDTFHETWLICKHCRRALKPRARADRAARLGLAGLLRPHRVRSRTTRSLDKTRDALANITGKESR